MERIEGLFIALTREEEAALREVLDTEGLDFSARGVKQYLFALIHDSYAEGETCEEDEETAAEKWARFMGENRESVEAASKIAAAGVNMLRQALHRRKV